MHCIERLAKVINDLEEVNIISDWEDEDSIAIVDDLFGAGKYQFNIVAETASGTDVTLTAKIFNRLEGTQEAKAKAYEYLLSLQSEGYGVYFVIDQETGYVGVTIQFECDTNLRQLTKALLHNLNNLSSFLNANYECIFEKLCELGIDPFVP